MHGPLQRPLNKRLRVRQSTQTSLSLSVDRTVIGPAVKASGLTWIGDQRVMF